MLTPGEVPDQEKSLGELRRVLRPDGRLVVGELFGDLHWVRLGALKERAARAYLSLEGRVGGPLAYFAAPPKQPSGPLRIAQEPPVRHNDERNGRVPQGARGRPARGRPDLFTSCAISSAHGGQAARRCRPGPRYLAHAGSLIGVLLALAVALFLGRLHRASLGAEAPAPASSLRRLWLAASLGLVLVYVGQ